MLKMNIPEGLLFAHFYDAANDVEVRPRIVPNDWEWLEMIYDGEVDFEEDGKLTRYRRGTLFWHIGCDHTIWRTVPGKLFKALVLKVKVSAIRRTAPHVTVFTDSTISEHMASEIRRLQNDSRLDRDVWGMALYTWLFYEVHKAHLDSVEASYPKPLQRALEFTQKSDLSNLRVRDLVRAAYCSEPHLYSLFRKHLDCSPHKYLLKLRLNYARTMLQNDMLSIKEIALQCGFERLSHFYRAYRTTFGITPGNERDRMSNAQYLTS